MYAPVIRSARVLKRYRARQYEAALFTDIKAEGSISYEYIVVVFEPGSQDPFLFITSERNDPSAQADFLSETGLDAGDVATEGESHFLCVFEQRGHRNLGGSDAWGDLDTFEAAALRLLADTFGGEPEVELVT